MSLKHLDLPININTSQSSPIDNLFVPALKNSINYDVAVGYFSSNWIRDASEGIAHFAANGGQSRWVISPELSEQDKKLIQETDNYDFVFEKKIDQLIDALNNNVKEVLCWLIKDRIMEFKIAVPKNKLSGMFHAKTGIFTDDVGDSISFNGSYNMTGAASTNWEKIDIYSSWDNSEKKRVEVAKEEFNAIWNNKDNNLNVYNPTEIIITNIKNKIVGNRPYELHMKDSIEIPQSIELRGYQKEAIDDWFRNNGRGMYIMATGSGKTITALSTISKLCKFLKDKNNQLFVLIIVPYKHLLEQWIEEAEVFGIKPVKCFESSSKWVPVLQDRLNSLDMQVKDVVVAITTNSTFSLDKLQSIISRISTNFLLVADEAHNLGSEKYNKALPEIANFRLGLTATPDRKGDIQGTKFLKDYFGDAVAEFTLADAINNKFLCEYNYYPVLCYLNEDEMHEYKELTRKIAQEFAKNDENSLSTKMEYLLRLRGGILSLSEDKLVKLKEILKANESSKYNLIYCGDASDENERHIEKVLLIAGKDINMRIRKFTADESIVERKEILSQFSNGEIDAIAAIRCLDEGVDVPRTETAYILASSSNPRQFVQRRGRVLRKATGKKYANIYDFIALPDLGKFMANKNEYEIERKMVKSELIRVSEFADAALNKAYALKALRNIRKKYNLMDI